MASDDGDVEEFQDCLVKKSTDKALLIEHDDLGSFWVPRSQVCATSEIPDDASEGDTGTLTVPRWWASKEGLV